jgi:hypothetical protein
VAQTPAPAHREHFATANLPLSVSNRHPKPQHLPDFGHRRPPPPALPLRVHLLAALCVVEGADGTRAPGGGRFSFFRRHRGGHELWYTKVSNSVEKKKSWVFHFLTSLNECVEKRWRGAKNETRFFVTSLFGLGGGGSFLPAPLSLSLSVILAHLSQPPWPPLLSPYNPTPAQQLVVALPRTHPPPARNQLPPKPYALVTPPLHAAQQPTHIEPRKLRFQPFLQFV